MSSPIQPLVIDTPRVWKGHFGVPEKRIYKRIKSKLIELEKNWPNSSYGSLFKDTNGSVEQVGNCFSTSAIDEYRPHKLEEFRLFYKHLYKDLVSLYFEVYGGTSPQPHSLEKVFDTGFYSVKTDHAREEFGRLLKEKPEYWEKKLHEKFFIIERSWFNINYEGGQTTEHHHIPSPFVCSYYLNVPQGGGDFLIRSRNPLWKEDKWKEEMVSIPVKSGDYLIFCGDIPHGAQPNTSKEERIVMSTNISLKDY
tara:strand:- start:185 stop:940 length:756 start_codon:yes stop_codon:yes gene_type:complete